MSKAELPIIRHGAEREGVWSTLEIAARLAELQDSVVDLIPVLETHQPVHVHLPRTDQPFVYKLSTALMRPFLPRRVAHQACLLFYGLRSSLNDINIIDKKMETQGIAIGRQNGDSWSTETILRFPMVDFFAGVESHWEWTFENKVHQSWHPTVLTVINTTREAGSKYRVDIPKYYRPRGVGTRMSEQGQDLITAFIAAKVE